MTDEKQDKRIVVLVSAGASYGSVGVRPGPPPLGDQLFGTLCAAFPRSWGNLESGLAAEFEANFELGMDKAWWTGKRQPTDLLWDLAQYFSIFRPTQQSAYAWLVTSLHRKGLLDRTQFVSLNSLT
jgi:hypothetical protein